MTKQEEQSEIFKKVYFPEKPKKDGEYTCGNDNFSFKLNFMKGVWVCQNPIAIAWFYEPIEPQPPLEGDVKEISALIKMAIFKELNDKSNPDAHFNEKMELAFEHIDKMLNRKFQSKPVEGDVSDDGCKFTQGYTCAVANLVRMHGESTEARELLNCNHHTIKDLTDSKCDSEDIKILLPIIEELERRKNQHPKSK